MYKEMQVECQNCGVIDAIEVEESDFGCVESYICTPCADELRLTAGTHE